MDIEKGEKSLAFLLVTFRIDSMKIRRSIMFVSNVIIDSCQCIFRASNNNECGGDSIDILNFGTSLMTKTTV